MLPARVLWSRRILAVVSLLFVVGVVWQVFLAGLGVFVGAGWFIKHRDFIHVIEGLAPLAVVLVYLARAPRGAKWLAWATVALLYAQYATAGFRVTPSRQSWAAVHVVTAMLLFWSALQLARGSVALLGGAPND
jgi:hypothetical protein